MGPLQFKEVGGFVPTKLGAVVFTFYTATAEASRKKNCTLFSDKLLFALRTQTGCRFAVLIDQTRDYQNPNYEAFYRYTDATLLGSLGGSFVFEDNLFWRYALPVFDEPGR